MCIFANAQKFDINVSLNYALPQYDAFFDKGFESRPGLSLRARSLKSDIIKVGVHFEYNRFMPLIDNPIDIYDSWLYSFNFVLSFDLIRKSKNNLEPSLEIGYHIINYNEKEFMGGGIGLSPGINYLLYISDGYGIEGGIYLKNVFDKFGGNKNPAQTGSFQMIQIRIGVNIEIK